jgi:hypothetical protein
VESLLRFVQHGIEQGVTGHADSLAAYRTLPDLGYVLKDRDAPPGRLRLCLARIASQRGSSAGHRQHQSPAKPSHVGANLDEFVVPFDRRSSSSRGDTCLQIAPASRRDSVIDQETLVAACGSDIVELPAMAPVTLACTAAPPPIRLRSPPQ